MNFLLRTHTIAPEVSTIHESSKDVQVSLQPVTTLERLISKDSLTNGKDENADGDSVDSDNADGGVDAINKVYVENYSDVNEDEGWITIPLEKLPENWSAAPDIELFRSLDRSFVFPGEQIHLLACLAASKRNTGVITPFKVAALMSKNRKQQSKQHKKSTVPNSFSTDTDFNNVSQPMEIGNSKKNAGTLASLERSNTDVQKLIRMEDYRHQTEALLKRFSNSYFFVRIAEGDEPLWSKRSVVEGTYAGSSKTAIQDNFMNPIIDRGHFDGNVFGGLTRNTGRCCSLHNGDIVVLLEASVGTGSFKNPILEVIQFENYLVDKLSTEIDQPFTADDPCQELLKWLLPLDHTVPLPTRTSSPPLNSRLDAGSASQKPSLASLSSSQLFSFGNFRSYSTNTLPQANTSSSLDALPTDSKPSFDIGDLDYTEETPMKGLALGTKEHLSFRGVQLEPQRYFSPCGSGGMYLPGKRWRKKLEIIQPIEIQSFSAECNTEDLLCVQIKNVSPDHIPDIIVFVDAISIIFEEAPMNEEPSFLPLSCIEVGNDHGLPNLSLRRGEEHAFVLKPIPLAAGDVKFIGDKSSLPLQSNMETSGKNKLMITKMSNERNTVTESKYAILVMFRCNYTESKLFLKKPTSWKPRNMSNLMISVSSKISELSFGSPGRGISQLPIQELTLQATNSTDDDLTLTVLAPASFTAPPSVLSINSTLSSPTSPFAGFPMFMGRKTGGRCNANISMQRMNSLALSEGQEESNDQKLHPTSSLRECTAPVPDVINDSELRCTHLWLQSTVPLGCIPARSSAKFKLELLPLKDGIITLDTLQIAVEEKGSIYVPEHSLKIHVTSSVSTGIS